MVRSLFKSLRRLVPFRARVEYFRARRFIADKRNRITFAERRDPETTKSFIHPVFSHKAKLVRDYPEPWYSLQKNKIRNLALAAARINGSVIGISEIFSFWHLIGRTSEKRGYRNGMTIADGKLVSDLGGGLCQLSNALYWTALHCGCAIIERHRHSFDCFPDSYRSVPFGAGATVFYNYVDFRFRNDGESALLLSVYLDEEFLHIEAYSDIEWKNRFRIVEENHRYYRAGGVSYRENDLYRITIKDDVECAREHIAHNVGKLLYERDII